LFAPQHAAPAWHRFPVWRVMELRFIALAASPKLGSRCRQSTARRANAKPCYVTKGPARKRLPFRVRSRNWVVVGSIHPLVDLRFCIFSRLHQPLAFIWPPEVAVRLAAGKSSRSVKHDLVTARRGGTRHAGGYSQIGGSQAAHGGHRGRSGSPILSPPFKTVSHRTLRRLAAAYHKVAMLWPS
jgi:hypothetical protein